MEGNYTGSTGPSYESSGLIEVSGQDVATQEQQLRQGRRDSLKFLLATGLTVATGGVFVRESAADGHPAEARQDVAESERVDSSERAVMSATREVGAAAEAAAGAEEGHENEGISTANWLTAIPVVAKFGSILKRNADQEDPYVLGWDSFKSMAKVTGARLATLRFLDKGAYDHEMHELEISYALMAGLVGMAEATEHLEADEDRIFKGLKTLSDTLADTLAGSERPDSAEGTKEEWEKYVSAKEESVVDIDAQNFAISAVYAPELTTYTTGTLGNVLVGRMAKQLFELNLGKGMAKSGPEADFDTVQLAALEKTEAQINGPAGYMNLVLTYAGNLQGAGGIGDPPNLFLALRRKLGEWAKASGLGLAYANTSAIVANEAWLTRVAGVSPKNVQGGFLKQSAKSTAQTITSIPTSLYDAVSRDRQKKTDAVFSLLRDNNIEDVNADELSGIIGSIRRPGLSFDLEGFKGAFGHYFKGKEDGVIEDIAGRVYSQYLSRELDPDHEVVDHEIDSAIRFIDKSSKKPSDAIRMVVEEAGGIAYTQEVHELAGAFDQLVGTANPDGDGEERSEAMSALQRHEFVDSAEEAQEAIDAKIAELAERFDDPNRNEDEIRADFRELFAEHASVTSIVLPEKAQDAMYELWAKKIKADADISPEHGGLSHSAEEVLAALSTQILAATSASVLAEKALTSLGDLGLDVSHQRKIVMGLTAVLSAGADNVVAYLFGENVLINIHEQANGGELPKEMEQVLSQTAWILAIAGGAHSKIGNGPNFKMQKVRLALEDEEVSVSRDKNEFNDSLKNTWAFANTAALFEISRRRINNLENDLFALAA